MEVCGIIGGSLEEQLPCSHLGERVPLRRKHLTECSAIELCKVSTGLGSSVHRGEARVSCFEQFAETSLTAFLK